MPHNRFDFLNKASTLAQSLEDNTTSEEAQLLHASVSLEMSHKLAKGLATNVSLKQLVLNDCTIPDEGVQKIGASLGENRGLEKLKVVYVAVKDGGAAGIAEGMGKNEGLRDIALVGCWITAAGIRGMGISLGRNRTLQKLHISNIKIEDEGAEGLYQGLAANSSLRTLEIIKCGLEPGASGRIGEALAHNRTLESLIMVHNHALEEEGSEGIAKGLSKNSTLRFLNLNWCNMTPAGVRAVSSALEGNTTLQDLRIYVSEREEVDEATGVLTALLRVNMTLNHLSLAGAEPSLSCIAELGNVIMNERGGAELMVLSVPRLATAWNELGLPASCMSMTNDAIIERWHMRQDKILALCMGLHARLGGGEVEGRESMIQVLDADLVRLVGRMYHETFWDGGGLVGE